MGSIEESDTDIASPSIRNCEWPYFMVQIFLFASLTKGRMSQGYDMCNLCITSSGPKSALC